MILNTALLGKRHLDEPEVIAYTCVLNVNNEREEEGLNDYEKLVTYFIRELNSKTPFDDASKTIEFVKDNWHFIS